MIQIDNIEFSYGRKKSLFQYLNLELLPGNIYGLLGKNGAGKTTLLKLMSGLIFPKKGEISFNNITVRNRNTQFLSELFFMPEELFSPVLSIESFSDLYSPFYPRFDHLLFKKYLDEFELVESHMIPALSYGQRKKVHIAFGLASNTKILLFDEPTNGLDIPSKSAFRKIISETVLDERLVVISTHQIRDVDNIIDPLIIMDNGEILLNSDLYSLSEKYMIKYSAEEPGDGEAIYYQKTPQGYAVVCANESGNIQDIDLELLFNAVTNQPGKLEKLLKGGETIEIE